jgi:dipeptidyl aminopeptidase/acylaminoacyl peptidase
VTPSPSGPVRTFFRPRARALARALALAALLACTPTGALAQPGAAPTPETLEAYRLALSAEARYEGLVTGVVDQLRWEGGGARLLFRRSILGGFEELEADPATGAVRVRTDGDRAAPPTAGGGGPGGGGGPAGGGGGAASRTAPDGVLEARIEDHNLVVRTVGEGGEVVFRTHDGTEGNGYTLQSVAWSPDSERLVVYRTVPGYVRLVHYVESSPPDQLQPRHFTRNYTKPGDRLASHQPFLVDPRAGTAVEVDRGLFPDPYALSNPRWRDDGREFHFEYNERGHGVFRVIGVDARTGRPRAIVNEEPETFFYYRPTSATGKYFRRDLDDGREILWMSERSGWSHLYLLDGATGRVKNAVTSGDWVVRHVVRVDEEARELWFAASGMDEGRDPYYVHYFRVNFDGSGLERLTHEDATHELTFAPDGRHYVLGWSRVDLPPVTVLVRTGDAEVVAELGVGDHAALLAAGWIPPEPFVAKGRDGVTDIWGIIVRPSTFDPSVRYPVIESIYAGPHDSHVPKAFSVFPTRGMLPQAELGFVVVMIDGMGTSNRSKAFHDVAWKNLGDAGFPDRILWHRAVAERYPWYDVDRVGIYGGSAGGQNAMGALLFHGDFYHAAVADNGCHDNRMDKIWWNELWMGKVGPHYDASSNVTNAHLLRGRLLLTVGELDSNVDPSSTYQVVDALIRAGKDFDFLMIPGGEHARGPVHERRRFDFFVRHLLGAFPPNWNDGGVAPAGGAP